MASTRLQESVNESSILDIRATNSLLVLDFRLPQCIRLELSDNGVGTTHPAAHSGYGLIGLRERIELLGGRIETANRLDGGFALTVEVPA